MIPNPLKGVHLAVKEAYDAGLCVVPPREDGSKAPESYWKQFQEEKASLEILRDAYRNGRTGIGIVCGRVSGELECMDFDTPDMYRRYKQACGDAGLDDVLERIELGYSESTPHGFHLLYRPLRAMGCRKLARDENFDTLIEIKAEGGYIIVSPTFGGVNRDGPYVRMSGSSATIAAISNEDRDALYRVAESFDRTPRLDGLPYYGPVEGAGDRIGDDFIRRGSWDFLADAGWTKVAEGVDSDGNPQEFWRRPGKDQGNSAVLHLRSGLFYVFSTSTPFPVVPAAYNKFRTYAFLMHGGDFKAATLALKAEGFRAREEPAVVAAVRLQYGQIIRADQLRDLEVPDIATLPLLGRDGFFIEGGSNLLYGYPKAGKTDLSMALIREWIGQGRRVCYFSEEPLPFWKHRLAGLDDGWDYWEPLLIAEAMGWGIAKLLDHFTDDDVVFVDTIRSVAGYRENKVDEDVGKIIEPMILAARERAATLVAGYHARKMPGEDGTDISGHHSLFGAFDRAIQVKKMAGEDNDRKRKVKVFGRLLNPEQPDALIYEMTGPCRFRPLDQKEATRLIQQLKPCEGCGSEFTQSRRDQRYCSDSCRKRASRSVSRDVDGE